MVDKHPQARYEGKINAAQPHSARIWNYWLGGKDNYQSDRMAGETIKKMAPSIVNIARQDRAFLSRAVRHLTEECGVRQFLDIGTGLPTADNTHEVAQRSAPDCKIVYVDNDPLVLVHARALLTSTSEGECQYIDSDLREPNRILQEAARTLDLSKPVAIMMLEILLHIEHDEDALQIIRTLVSGVGSGSYLTIAHGTNVVDPEGSNTAVNLYNEQGRPKAYLRTGERLARFFDGLDLVEPGLVTASRWRPGETPFGEPAEVDVFAGVARKP